MNHTPEPYTNLVQYTKNWEHLHSHALFLGCETSGNAGLVFAVCLGPCTPERQDRISISLRVIMLRFRRSSHAIHHVHRAAEQAGLTDKEGVPVHPYCASYSRTPINAILGAEDGGKSLQGKPVVVGGLSLIHI